MNLPADRGAVATIFEHRANGVATFSTTPPVTGRGRQHKFTFAGLIRYSTDLKRAGWYVIFEEPLFPNTQEVPA